MVDLIELYAGSGTLSKQFSEAGYSTYKVDIRKRKGICEPDLKADIFNLSATDLPTCKWLWCSFPCQVFSYAAGDYHFKYGEPVSEQAHYYLKLLKHTLQLITEKKPQFYFIENPRGQLRYIKTLLDWLVKNDGMTKELTYSSYGFPTTKPTNIFTNAHSLQLRSLDGWGRGNKNPFDMFDKLTTCQRQKIPLELAIEILAFCQKSTAPFLV